MNKFDGSETLHFEGELLGKRLQRVAEMVRDGREDELQPHELEDLKRFFKSFNQELEQWQNYMISHYERQLPKKS